MNLPEMAQNEQEFNDFLELLTKEPIESILEIGSWQGGTLARFGARFPFANLVSIDPSAQIEKWSPEWGAVHFVVGKSQDQAVRNKAIEVNDYRKFTVTFIDGDHEIEPCTQDWLWAREITSKIVAFHDIADSNNPMIEVWKLWNSIQHQSFPMYRTKEIRNDGANYGIGVVYL